MKKASLFAVVFGLLSVPALAALPSYQFMVQPDPGVTVDQLSSARVQEIASRVTATYAAGTAAADTAYQNTVAGLQIDPSNDHSGEILNNQMKAAMEAQEAAYRDAAANAVATGNALCNGLCVTVATQNLK